MYFFHILIYDYYLYSPSLYLSKKYNLTLVFFLFGLLLILPYISTIYLFLIFYILITIFYLQYLPKIVKLTVYNLIIILCTLFMINIYVLTVHSIKNLEISHIINLFIFQPFIFISKLLLSCKIDSLSIITFKVYIAISAIRILLITINTFFIFKLILLTTPYELINYYYCRIFRYSKIHCNFTLMFMISLSSQILKIFMQKIRRINIAYLIRGTTSSEKKHNKGEINIIYSLMQEFIRSFWTDILYIIYTLHSRDIKSRSIYYFKVRSNDY